MEETLQLVQVEPGQIRIGDNGYFRKFIRGYQRIAVRKFNHKRDKVYIDCFIYRRIWKSLKNPISISEVYKYS